MDEVQQKRAVSDHASGLLRTSIIKVDEGMQANL